MLPRRYYGPGVWPGSRLSSPPHRLFGRNRSARAFRPFPAIVQPVGPFIIDGGSIFSYTNASQRKARMAVPVILSAVRTPVGKFLGALAELTAPQLGGIAVAEAVRRAGIQPGQVDEVI